MDRSFSGHLTHLSGDHEVFGKLVNLYNESSSPSQYMQLASSFYLSKAQQYITGLGAHDYRSKSDHKLLQLATLERDTWSLVSSLSKLEDYSNNDSMEISCDLPQFNHELLKEQVYSNNSELRRMMAVVKWLEDVEYYNLQYVFKDISRSSTKIALQTSKNTISPRIVQHLDPDAGSREGRRFHPQDLQDEATFLKYVWGFIRCGRLDDAIEFCGKCKQYWRAASLRGGVFYADSMTLDSTNGFHGNPTRLLWKQACRNIAESESVTPIEKAIYGSLSASPHHVFPVCSSWYDVIWILLKATVDHHIDEMLAQSVHTNDQQSSFVSSSLASSKSMFEQAEAISNTLSSDDMISFFHSLQKRLILQEYTEACKLLVDLVQSSSPLVSMATRSFSFHLYLYIFWQHQHAGKNTDEVPQEFIDVISTHLRQLIDSYLKSSSSSSSTESHRDILVLISQYSLLLPTGIRIDINVHFLKQLDEDGRKEHISIAREYYPADMPVINKLLVSSILNEDHTTHDIGSAVHVSTQDNAKIRALDCFLLSDSPQLDDALVQANALFRAFVWQGKLQAASQLCEHLRPPHFGESRFFDADDNVPIRILDHWREYSCWRRYIFCLKYFQTWQRHNSHPPSTPVIPSNVSSTRQQGRIEEEQRAYEKRLANWTEQDQSNMENATVFFVETLQIEHGFLVIAPDLQGQSDDTREVELHRLRQRCIPGLVFMLHKMCFDSGKFDFCYKMAEMIASETHELYTAFSPEDFAIMLKNVAEAYIERATACTREKAI